jgi:hypothetical protein
MGPGLRRDDGLKASGLEYVILAQARIHSTPEKTVAAYNVDATLG